MSGPFGWDQLRGDQWTFLREPLSELEKLTWKEILFRDGAKNHLIEVSRLSKAARDRLVECQFDDVDELLSLRIRSRERVFGTLRHGVFYALWWDPNHLICPAVKKHT